MRRSILMGAVCSVLFLVGVSPGGAASGIGGPRLWPGQDEGVSVNPGQEEIEIGAWIEILIPGDEEAVSKPSSGSAKPPPCSNRVAGLGALLSWFGVDQIFFPDSGEQYILTLCQIGGDWRLVSYRVFDPTPPVPPPIEEVVRQEAVNLRNEAWGSLAIPEPHTRTAPATVSLVQIPTYVWVPAADRVSVSETVSTELEGHTLTLTATAQPRRSGFLRADMGDGNTLWCNLADVVAFDQNRDPFDQRSKCYHFYRHSSVFGDNDRYPIRVTTFWDVSIQCVLDGGPCADPPPAVPTQSRHAAVYPLAVAEIQALAQPPPQLS